MVGEKQGLRQLAAKTVVAYVRMAATVVIAVVVRLCLDCFGLILTDQEPAEALFAFAHCHKDSTCVLTGVTLFFATLVGCSIFAWSCQEWITDPVRNPYARRYSFAIIVEAAAWIPISVVVGKTNALVEWFMDISKDDRVQALLSSTVALLLTLSCALVTHLAMKHCRSVQKSARVKEAGWAGFGKFFLLATLYCLGWAVGWSNWELVLSVMDALEPGRSMHNAMLSAGVILSFLILSTCFYLRYGPEPIIPDPQLQQLCYSHGYSSSVRRSLVSYVTYSCVIFIVMCCCDPNYGLLSVLANEVYASSTSAVFDATALLVLCSVACLVTLVAALCSAAITWAMEVDESSSMKLSRSVHDNCRRMVSKRRTVFEALLTQVLEDGSDARLVEAREFQRAPPPVALRSLDVEDEQPLSDGDDPADGTRTPRCDYSLLEVGLGDYYGENADIESERQLQLNPGSISRALCASVLVYDVLGFVVCGQWGMIALRCYSVLFGRLAGIHDALYALSCLVYAAAVVLALSRLVFVLFPSTEERNVCEAEDPQKVVLVQDARAVLEPGCTQGLWVRLAKRLAWG
mmetsp:Transcript_108561/g.330035  ORF Transcript_108561/g.330035 Transcript_108561/m.330035 type:complete len:575 (-) Transcript_108561:128-1852(-)